ncbi:NFACT family protein [Chloroflexus sp.]|uniref:Rqc2 family fibronectin-binding protein n=1 Tax=Chloroflexus sp. TaxID=1904827 RepID=UPI00298EDABD|nr:NFACT RNA binding domain-containing protein [Chloroflexus sp.]MDW8403367.1 NFACT RNA binding domain-containing protein [Chloroflexus sp.]
MYFDALTLNAVVEELRASILFGRIQRVVLVGPLTIGLEVYAHGQRRYLLASADAQTARIHLVSQRLTRGVDGEPPFLLLMRKYLLGGRIVGIEQPPYERVVLFSITKAAESRKPLAHTDELADDELDADETAEAVELLRCDLIVEPQDRRSNIILVDDNNLILDAIKRVTPRMSSRVIMPRRVYELPPTPAKRDPLRATAAEIEAVLGPGDPVKALVNAYRGISPQAAREVLARACGAVPASGHGLPAYTIAARLREIVAEPPAPHLISDENGPTAYAPYRPLHLPGAVAMPSMSAALEAFYTARLQPLGHDQRRAELATRLLASREQLARQREQIAAELARANELDRLRWEGEMIFAFLHQLPRGATELAVEGERIALDPSRSLVEQAQERFKAYEKAKSARAVLPARLAETEARLAGLDQLLALLAVADDATQIDLIAAEAEEAGYVRPSPIRRRPPRSRPLQVRSSDGLPIYVGRTARQNEEVTFRIARPTDFWLHARNIHGAHVIIRADNPPERTIAEAAALAAYYSQARNDAAVEVDLCRRRAVRKIPGGPTGLVSYHPERTLRAKPQLCGEVVQKW